MKQTKLQRRMLYLLNDTAEFYNLTNRSLAVTNEVITTCVYTREDGKHCAIGRKLNKVHLDFIKDNPRLEFNSLPVSSLFSAFKSEGIKLPASLKGLSLYFLDQIQTLHDEGSNWTRTGLSSLGAEKYEDIKTKILKGKFGV